MRVFRDARAVGRVTLRHRRATTTLVRRVRVNNLDGRRLPITTREPVERGAFRASWGRRRGAADEYVFRLVSLRDRWGNR